ncbi:MAG TPA: PepSY domain-containing protein [Anaeromyxobacter sp.]|nr:PepSY domain-containing protein [Anaeromyxobacter sp.]
MRALPLAAVLAALPGCIVVEPHRHAASPPVSAAPPVRAAVTQEQAIDIAFRAAQGRGLDVDRVHHVNYDGSGRWHVDLRGRRDKAKALVDARDGRILKLDTKDK